MSATIPPTPSAPFSIQPPIRDQIIAGATSLNGLVKTAETVDPGFAAQLKTKAAIYSKTNWFVPLSMILTAVGTHYGFTLDADTTATIVVAVGSAVTWIMRRFTKGAVSGVVSVPVSPAAV
jgi:hypothetical protein